MDSHNQWQRFDPSLELVWLGHNDKSFSITAPVDEEKEMDQDILSLLSSDESSSDDNDSPGGLTSYVCFTTPYQSSRSPIRPMASPSTKENKCPNVKSPSKTPTARRNGLKTTKLFACGVNDQYHEDSSSELQLVSTNDTMESPTSALSRSFEKTADDLSGIFLCNSLRKQSQKGSLLETARGQRQSIFSRKSCDPTIESQVADYFLVKQSSLPERHGPIRRELPLDDTISSSNSSEATTDQATNVSFAKLAAMIITSQAAKKAVEPIDRIATVLELKGVGRGILSLREYRQATSLRLLIDDYSEANFWPLLDSLYTNKSLEKLELVRNSHNGTTRARTNQEMDCLFRVIHRSTSTLTELHLSNFVRDEMCCLSKGLAHHTSLQHLQIHLETGTLSHSFCRILANLPNLVSIEAQVCHAFPISELLYSTSLSVVSILCSSTAFAFEGDEILRLAQQLQYNTTLSVLSLEPFICSNVGLPAILQVLKTSNRCLDTFQFSCGISTFEQGDWALQQMLDTLQANSKLRVLWNNCYESWSVTAHMRQRTLQVLKQHESIQQFHIFPEAADYWYHKNNILYG